MYLPQNQSFSTRFLSVHLKSPKIVISPVINLEHLDLNRGCQTKNQQEFHQVHKFLEVIFFSSKKNFIYNSSTIFLPFVFYSSTIHLFIIYHTSTIHLLFI